MMLKAGDNLLVVHRRLFREDGGRYFIGTVDEYEHGIVRITGRSIIRNDYNGDFLSKKGLMTKIFSISSGTLITYVIPSNVELKDLSFEHKKRGEVWLVGPDGFELNLTEHSVTTTLKRD
jgi:hypothetical protein